MKTFTKAQAFNTQMQDAGNNPLVDLFGNDPAIVPSVHIKEEKNIYKLQVALPGFTKKDFNIYVEGNMLVISCKKELEAPQENYRVNFSRKECNYSYFSRFLSLPDNADSDHIRAKYNGTLNLSIPKKNIPKKK